jgi:hypothetical protein
LFNSRDYIVPFLDYLNRKHPNIKFTFEIENDDNILPFLDISSKRFNGNFEISVYRKPTFTGLFTNFESFYRLLTKKVSFSLSCFVILTSAPHIKFFTLNLKNSKSFYFKMVTQNFS